jgi:hypothetical protein
MEFSSTRPTGVLCEDSGKERPEREISGASGYLHIRELLGTLKNPRFHS